ncbi:ATPase [Maribius pontilimi]|uniref:ATPase n=1 Tax=Palleronia pontilimi TaxID=1964209 RepID=A0A934IC72_9RHOB|nr:ATP12 family protein [Palleronia pontilimi]MBJ3764468.1 ATPase [Palleronia pontilimi]
MSEWKMRRFWKVAGVRQDAAGFGITLDDKPLRTPAKSALVVPTRALADAIATEWNAQGDHVEPGAMPVTRSANSAIDKVAPQTDAVIAMLAEYGGTDLLSYRADRPQALIDAQARAWDPMLDWAEAEYGARLVTTSGVMPVAQDPDALGKLERPMHGMSPFELAGLHDLIALSGSLVLGLAVVEGGYAPDTIWSKSRVDEEWQAQEWGEDEEAGEMAERKRQDFLFAHTFVGLARSIG